MIQSDNGPEFSQNFTERIKIIHRHSRVRKSNDNAHVERFNRTIQEECLDRVPENMSSYLKAISEYLEYYNHERLHLGINKKTPSQIISECFQAID
ncbi:transposase [Candidatus Peregrinibacteria bacterium]|nr:transposase [Candidatus Peregrinibacteria bacterium]